MLGTSWGPRTVARTMAMLWRWGVGFREAAIYLLIWTCFNILTTGTAVWITIGWIWAFNKCVCISRGIYLVLGAGMKLLFTWFHGIFTNTPEGPTSGPFFSDEETASLNATMAPKLWNSDPNSSWSVVEPDSSPHWERRGFWAII